VSRTVTNYSYDGHDRLGLRTSMADTLPTTVTPSTGRAKSLTFEGQALVDPSSGGDAVVGTVSMERTSPLKERASARVNNVGTSYVREDFTAANSVYVAALLRVDALPSATAEILTIRNGATTVGNLALTTAGTLQLRNGSTVLATSAALTVGTVYRIGLRQTKGTGSSGILEGFLSAGDSAFGAAFHSRTNQLHQPGDPDVGWGNHEHRRERDAGRPERGHDGAARPAHGRRDAHDELRLRWAALADGRDGEPRHNLHVCLRPGGQPHRRRAQLRRGQPGDRLDV